MAELERLMKRVWDVYRKRFAFLSVGVIVALIVSFILYYIGYWLLGRDPVVMFLVTSFLLGGIYVSSRYVVEEKEFEDLSIMMARYVLSFAIFTLLVVLGMFLPPYLGAIYDLVIVSLFYMMIPIVSELGFVEGWKKLKELIKKRGVSYIGLNWLFFLGLFAILSLATSQILAPIVVILLLFLYFPLYSLTGYYLARWARGT